MGALSRFGPAAAISIAAVGARPPPAETEFARSAASGIGCMHSARRLYLRESPLSKMYREPDVMKSNWTETRLAWLVLGMVLGGVLSVYWPQEPAYGAYAASGGDRFCMCVGTTTIGTSDAVFLLDQTSGRLVGGIYANGKFGALYARNLAADFGVTDKAHYNMVPASVGARVPGRGQTAEASIFVGEESSGLVIMYAFQASGGVNELIPVTNFRWRGV